MGLKGRDGIKILKNIHGMEENTGKDLIKMKYQNLVKCSRMVHTGNL